MTDGPPQSAISPNLGYPELSFELYRFTGRDGFTQYDSLEGETYADEPVERYIGNAVIFARVQGTPVAVRFEDVPMAVLPGDDPAKALARWEVTKRFLAALNGEESGSTADS